MSGVTSRRRVTIRDVALAAGVSTTTVSDALRGNGRLPAATRGRVAQVAKAQGDQVVRALSGLGIPVVTCGRDLTPGAAALPR
jgi:hypothetical protein